MTGRVEKTVFISYRRTNSFTARAVYQSLVIKGYDVFFDFEGINSGDFEQIILSNIRARAHFLVILTPSALERCNNPKDWLRREIETAIDEKRNIVPLFFEGFNFGSPSISQHLNGKMALLKKYNGLNVPADYFNEAIDKLTNRFLNVPLDAVLQPLSINAKKQTEDQLISLNKASAVMKSELSSEEWYEKGYKSINDPEKAKYYFLQAIKLKPDYAEAFYNCGVAEHKLKNYDAALVYFTEAIRIDPTLMESYYGRGLIFELKKDYPAALADFRKYLESNYEDRRFVTKIHILACKLRI
jgi:tetratricopeptide (TPR) repeat protein